MSGLIFRTTPAVAAAAGGCLASEFENQKRNVLMAEGAECGSGELDPLLVSEEELYTCSLVFSYAASGCLIIPVGRGFPLAPVTSVAAGG